MILEPPKIKSATVSTVSPSICHEVMGPDAMILVFWMLSFRPTFSLGHFFQGCCSAFIMIGDLNPVKKKSIVQFGLFPSRWTDEISKELKMITELNSQNLIYAYEENYSHLIVVLASCGILRTLIEAIYKRNYFIMISKQLI